MKSMPPVHLLFATLFMAFLGETLAHPVLYELRLRTTPDAMLTATPYAIIPRFELQPRISFDGPDQYEVSLRSLWIDEARRRQEDGGEETKRFKAEDFFLHPPPHRHGRRHMQ